MTGVEAALLLKAIDLVEIGYSIWDDWQQDEADLEIVRKQMEGMTREEKVAFLQRRSDALQAKADELARQ